MFFPHPHGSFCRATGIVQDVTLLTFLYANVHFSGMTETLDGLRENLQEKKVSCRFVIFPYKSINL